MNDVVMREIPMPPDSRPTAEQASIDAACSDDGLRVLAVSAIWRRDELPTAAAQHGGFVYEIANRVAKAVERREQAIRAERDALRLERDEWRSRVKGVDEARIAAEQRAHRAETEAKQWRALAEDVTA